MEARNELLSSRERKEGGGGGRFALLERFELILVFVEFSLVTS